MSPEPRAGGGRIEALLFDLDDTLVDTYNALITPLERGAARSMRATDPSLPSSDELTDFLLELRQGRPDEVEVRFRHRFPLITEEALAARRDHLTRVSLDGLRLSVAVRDLLMQLRRRYRMYLITTGDRALQEAKITRLNLGELFDDMTIVESDVEEAKEPAIAALLIRHGHPSGAAVVIGNRLDNEIRAGNRLGLPTVWIRHGEGRALEPGEATGTPDYVIGDVLELPTVLDQLSRPA